MLGTCSKQLRCPIVYAARGCARGAANRCSAEAFFQRCGRSVWAASVTTPILHARVRAECVTRCLSVKIDSGAKRRLIQLLSTVLAEARQIWRLDAAD